MEGTLRQVDATTGVVTDRGTPCGSGASNGDDLLLAGGADPTQATWYSDGSRVESNDPDLSLPSDGASAAASSGEEVFLAPHTGGRVTVRELGSGTLQRSIVLDGFAGWQWGLVVISGQILIVDDGRVEGDGERTAPTLRRFDARTGAAGTSVTLDLPVGMTPHGLACSGG